jgi:hypothetical protein
MLSDCSYRRFFRDGLNRVDRPLKRPIMGDLVWMSPELQEESLRRYAQRTRNNPDAVPHRKARQPRLSADYMEKRKS